jgi:hypothetical protein
MNLRILSGLSVLISMIALAVSASPAFAAECDLSCPRNQPWARPGMG